MRRNYFRKNHFRHLLDGDRFDKRVHFMNLFHLILDRPFSFIGIIMLLSALIYVGLILYAQSPFSIIEFLFITMAFNILLLLFVPLFVFLLACCEMIAEYLACMLFPRSKL